MRRLSLITVCLLIFACASQRALFETKEMAIFDACRAAVDTSVKDSERAARARLVVTQIEANIKELMDRIVVAPQEDFRLNSDYDAKREDFDALFERLHQDREQATTRMIAYLMDLRKDIEPAEWPAFRKALGEFK